MKQENKRLLYSAVTWGCCLIVALSWGCTEADWRDEPDRPVGERLQVEIPVAEVPLRKVEPIDTKAMTPPAETPSSPPAETPSSPEGVPSPSPERVPPLSPEGVTPVSSPKLATRAAAIYKRAIILQYSTDGNTLLNAQTTDIDNYTIGTSISAQLAEATNCKIYVYVVNETTTTGADATFSTEAKLKAATYDLYGKFPAATAGDIPLIGSLSGINVVRQASGNGDLGVIQNPTEANSKVMLSRIAAELNIQFYYNVPGFHITPARATLQNVPQTFHLFEQSGTVFPAEGTAAAFGSVEFTLTAFDGDKADESATQQVRYVPMNRRGSNSSIAYPKDKWSGTAPGARCTYLTFTATNKQNTAHKLVYSFYFGGNNTANFDVLRNAVYTMNSTILQRSAGDNRIVEAGLAPLVATEPTVESISSTGATIKGTVTDKHGMPITSYGFYYKKGVFANPANPAADGTKAGEKTGDLAVGTPFSHTLTGLTTNTAYSFVAYATSANGTSYGEPIVFGTNAPGLPTLGTQAQLVSAADGKSASSTGNTTTGTVLSNGIVWSTQTGFDHLTSGTRANGNPATGSPYAVTVSNLTPGTTYYYRYFASNATGFVYGNTQQSVRTFDILTVSSAAAVTSTVVDKLRFTATTAKKNAADPSPTATGVKLWTTDPGSNLGAAAAATVLYDSPTAVGAKTADWTAMTAGQTYWYASYATNSVGNGYSGKQSFTASAALTATPSSTEVGPQAATITIPTTGRNTKATASNGATVASGDGTASKSISIAAYTGTADRSPAPTVTLTTIGELPLRSVTQTITQCGVVFPASFSSVTNVPKAGKTATNVSVTANIPWKATSSETWCTIGNATQTGANTKTGSAINFTYTVAKNIGAARSATITVAGTGSWTSFSRTFTVAQLPGGQIDLTPGDPNKDNSNVNFELPVIDLTGEPSSVVLTRTEAKARCRDINAQTISPTAYVSPLGMSASGENGTWNAKMSPLFQVMRANLTLEGQNWVTAYTACRTYSGEGGTAGQWRLPTKKELQKIYDLRGKLESMEGFSTFSDNYLWSCTELHTNAAWVVQFRSGYTSGNDKTDSYPRVRCVRDL